MIRPLARASALLLAAPFLTFASGLAAAHVHEPEPGDDQDHIVAHSHFAPHHAEAHEAADHPEFDHDDEQVVWLDSGILHEASYQTAAVPPAVGVSDGAVLTERRWSVTPFDDAAPVHGPPRPASPFRGPPPFLA